MILCVSCNDKSKLTPVRVVAELNIGESQDVELSNGEKVELKLLQIYVVRDSVRNAIRSAHVRISVVGNEILSFGDGAPQVTVKSKTVDRKITQKGNP